MRGASGVKLNWPVVAIAFAVIGVPMGVAVIQDLGSDTDEEDLLARIGEVGDIADDEDEGDEADLEEADDIAGRWHEPAMDQAFFDEVFLGGPDDDRPALRGPLAGLEWGARQAEPPDLSRWPRAEVELMSSGPPHERLRAVYLTFPDDGTAGRIFASRWGEPLELPVVSDHGDFMEQIWFDPDRRIKLSLGRNEHVWHALITPYIPAREYIDANGRFAFESYPILGATPGTLASKYGPRFELGPGGETGTIECPGIETSDRFSECSVSFAGGRAVQVSVTIVHGLDLDAGPAVFAALRNALGEVRDQASDDHENRWTFDRGYTVTQRVGEPVITVVRVAR